MLYFPDTVIVICAVEGNPADQQRALSTECIVLGCCLSSVLCFPLPTSLPALLSARSRGRISSCPAPYVFVYCPRRRRFPCRIGFQPVSLLLLCQARRLRAMPTRSIFTAFILSLTTAQAWRKPFRPRRTQRPTPPGVRPPTAQQTGPFRRPPRSPPSRRPRFPIRRPASTRSSLRRPPSRAEART